MISRRGHLLCQASILVFASQAAFAQEVAGTSGKADDEIVVTAQKREERINDVPIAITAITGSLLRDRGISDPTQLERLVTGFTYQKSSYGPPIFNIRGVGFYDATLGVTPAVAVYTDQVALPYSIMTRGATLDLERVEVLKGPQGTLFGQNATAGAVNYIAAKPTSNMAGGLTLSYGRFNAVETEGFLSGPLTDTLTARISVRTEQQDEWQKSYTRNDSLGAKNFVVGRLLVDWKPSDRLSFELNLNGWLDKSDTQAPQMTQVAYSVPPPNAFPPAVAGLDGYPTAPANARAADWDPNTDFSRDDKFYQTALRGDYNFGDSVTLTSITAFTRLDTDSILDGDGTAYLAFNPHPTGVFHAFSQELRLAGTADRMHWMLGGNYQAERADETQYVDPLRTSNASFGGIPMGGLVLGNYQRVKTKAAFASLDYKLTDTLTAAGSLRYTDQRRSFRGCFFDTGDGQAAAAFGLASTILSGTPTIIAPGSCLTLGDDFKPLDIVRKQLNENNVSWRISLDWKPADQTMFYVSVAKGYKAGSFPTIAGLDASQYDPVTQESLLDYEVGIKHSMFGNALKINGAAFYYDYKDKQILGFASTAFGHLPKLVNIPKSRVYGAELEMTWRAAEGLRLFGGVTYVNSRVQKDPAVPIDPFGNLTSFVGEAFPNAPRWHIVGDAEYRFSVSSRLQAVLGSSLTYRSASYAAFGIDPRFRIDSYALLDLRAGIETVDGKWNAQIYGRNVTNKYYWTQVNHLIDTVTRYSGMPATYGVQIGYRF